MTFNSNIAGAQPAALLPQDMTDAERHAAIQRHLAHALDLARGGGDAFVWPLAVLDMAQDGMRYGWQPVDVEVRA